MANDLFMTMYIQNFDRVIMLHNYCARAYHIFRY